MPLVLKLKSSAQLKIKNYQDLENFLSSKDFEALTLESKKELFLLACYCDCCDLLTLFHNNNELKTFENETFKEGFLEAIKNDSAHVFQKLLNLCPYQ